MPSVLAWYLALTVVGAGAVQPASLLFGGLRSGGALFAKPLGLTLVALLAWIVAAETPLPYGTPLIVACAALPWAWTGWLVWRRPDLARALRGRLPLIAAGEALFVALFLVGTLARMQTPNATDTEKPMDLMLLTSIRVATSMPPEDGWFSGFTLSYYHLGHVMVDIVGRIAGQPPSVEMILGVSAAAAMAGVAAFALAGDLVALSPTRQRASAWLAGGVAVVSLCFLATAEGFAELLSAHGYGPPGLWAALGVDGLPGTQFTVDGVPTQMWWWWRATRVLPGTITEFPAFSVILGDPHAHLLALPLGVVALATALPAFAGREPLHWGAWRRNPGALVLAASVFAGLAMTNAWDAVIYGAVWGAAVLAVVAASGWPLFGGAVVAARYLALPALAAGLIAAPFLASLQAVPVGFEMFRGAASDPVRFLLVWSPLLVPLLGGVLTLRPRLRRDDLLAGAAGASAVVLAWGGGLLLAGQGAALGGRGAGWATLALLVATFGLAAAACAEAMRRRDSALASVLGLGAVCTAMVLATELFFLRDALGDRMNTVFKFWFAGWLILSVAGAAAVGIAYDRMRALRPRWLAVLAIALGAALYGGSLLYAPAATVARAREGQEPSLDSLAYVERVDPGMAEAIAWVRANLGRDDVLLEATSRDYSAGNAVSAATGVPTVLGWRGHEVTWRGNIPALSTKYYGVLSIYTDGATTESLARAKELGVTHVYLGREETSQFGPAVASRFAAWPTVFTAEGVRIVRVPREESR